LSRHRRGLRVRAGLHLRPGLHIRPGQQIRSAAFIAAAITLLVAAIVIVILLLSRHDGAATTHQPSAAPRPSPAVGALFARSAGGHLGGHFCTGSVVDSPGGDLVLTAAHCLAGHTAQQIAFIPGYVNGRAPYGIWTATRIIEDQNWQSSADPDDDFAFLVVSRPGSAVELQSLTGGEAIGIDGQAGVLVTVAGYPDGGNTQIRCQNTVILFSPTQLEFECTGYTDGTSGGPFLVDATSTGNPGTVIGVIGGYQQGGDSPSVSYAARFGPRMAALYQTAKVESAP
jgi:V8-like Glu-specific endopeptidase